MEDDPPKSTFSKTIALTYAGMGFFALIFLLAGIVTLYKASKFQLSLAGLLLSVSLALVAVALTYVMSAIYERRNWARYAAAIFWLMCLVWTTKTIVSNGSHPEPAAGPLKYSNAAQLEGARRAALLIPYLIAVLELCALYGLLYKASVVSQFTEPAE